MDASVSSEFQKSPTIPPQYQGTPNALIARFPSSPSSRVSEWAHSVSTLRPNRLGNLPPAWAVFSDTPLDRTSRSELTGVGRELGMLNSDSWAGQSLTAAIDITPSPMPPRVDNPVAGPIPLGPPEPTSDPVHKAPPSITTSEEGVSDYLLHTSEGLPNVTCIADQAHGPAKQHAHLIPQELSQTLERSIPPTIKESTPQVIEDPVASPVEDSVTLPVNDSIASPIEDRVISPTEDQAISPIDESVPPVTKLSVTPADKMPNPVPTEELTVSAAKDPLVLPDRLVIVGPNLQAIKESIAPQLSLTLSHDPQPPSYPYTVDTVVETLDIADTSETSGVVRETPSFTGQDQDEEDEFIVDAILASHSEFSAIPQNPQEKGENHTITPEVDIASSTNVGLDPTLDPSNLSMDTPPSVVRMPQLHPILPQEVLTPVPNTGGVAANIPLPAEHTVQESTAQPSGSRSVFKALWSGALQELTMAKESLQHVFVTPQRSSSGPPVNDTSDTVPSSPAVEGDFWDLDIEAVHGESQTEFVRACMAGPSSPANSQGDEDLPHSADQHRRVSIQQGTGTPCFVHMHYSQSSTSSRLVQIQTQRVGYAGHRGRRRYFGNSAFRSQSADPQGKSSSYIR